MSTNAVFFAWNYPVPGRERLAAEHFGEFVPYLSELQQQGTIESFDIMLLDPHGGDMNGFFLIRGESAKLDALLSSEEWVTHVTRSSLNTVGTGAVRGATGELVQERMELWTKLIPA